LKNGRQRLRESNQRVKIGSSIIVRVVVSVVLAAGAVGLFLLQRPKPLPPQPKVRTERSDWRTSLPEIDRDIDTILSHYGIEKSFCKKKQYPIPGAQISRIERKIELPIDIIPVQLNQVLNAMVHNYDGRAIASENTREHLVTIHLEINGYIIQTLILHPNASLKRKEQYNVPQTKT
jgi:hypothetical protein